MAEETKREGQAWKGKLLRVRLGYITRCLYLSVEAARSGADEIQESSIGPHETSFHVLPLLQIICYQVRWPENSR